MFSPVCWLLTFPASEGCLSICDHWRIAILFQALKVAVCLHYDKKNFFEDFDIFSSLATYTYVLALTKRISCIYDQNSHNVKFPKASSNDENKIFLSNCFSLVTKEFSHLLLL